MKIIKTILIICLSGLLLFNTTAQERVRIKRSEFKVKEDGFKDAWKAVKRGNSNYSVKATYRQAREQYLKAYKFNENNAELNYKLGICYLYSDDKVQAVKYLKKAYELNKEVTKDIHFQIARAYHLNYEFDNAIAEYKLYRGLVPERKLIRKNIYIENYITECETGKNLVSNRVRAIVVNLGKTVNSEYDDYAAVVDSREESIYFASRRPTKMNSNRNLLDQKFSEDIYLSKKKGKDRQAKL
jgi:tetratricopeptide (TPR) repeat protein